ncbi:MAG TPA: hypothetical protein VIQ52_16035, partial [Arthrobacter sp.]
LESLCRKHHRLKHTSGWAPTKAGRDEPPGWISPTGRHYGREHHDWEPTHWPRQILDRLARHEPDPALPDGRPPDEALPEGTLPEGTLPQDALPEATLRDEALPQDALPEDALPQDALPEGTLRDEALMERSFAELQATT